MHITLYTSYYQDTPTRQKELDFVFQQNVNCPSIDKIVCFLEGDKLPPVDHDKVEYIPSKRPTYKTFYEEINKRAAPTDISIVANSDIYFDDTLGLLPTRLNGKICVLLSRWDVAPGNEPKLHDCAGSQDAWIFMGRVNIPRYSEFNLGVPGCDNRMAWELSRIGYRLKNPARTIKSYHFHPSDEHTYHDENREIKKYYYIAKPYLFVEVTE